MKTAKEISEKINQEKEALRQDNISKQMNYFERATEAMFAQSEKSRELSISNSEILPEVRAKLEELGYRIRVSKSTLKAYLEI